VCQVRAESGTRAIDDLRPGDHACCQVRSENDYAAAVARSAEVGVERAERVLSLSDHVTTDQLRSAMAARGLAADALIASGQVVLHEPRAALAPRGRFDPASALKGYRRVAEEAGRDGYGALRAVADVGRALDGVASAREIVNFELESERVVGNSPLVALCGYDPTALEGASSAACAVHPICAHDDTCPFSVVPRSDDELVVTGEVDIGCAQAWRAVLDALASGEAADLTLDLSGLRFVDAAGMRALAMTAAELAERGGCLTLASARPVVRRCMRLLHLPDRFRWL
jgi:anti-anti-sigma factor